MAVLDSQDARRQFTAKLDAEEDASTKDHYFYIFRLGDTVAATTKISRGPRHTISDDLVGRMARQLGVTGKALSEAVSCELSAEDFYRLMAMGVPFRKRRMPKKRPNQSHRKHAANVLVLCGTMQHWTLPRQ